MIQHGELQKQQCSLRGDCNVPSNFFQCAQTSIVSERHIFMSEHLHFFTVTSAALQISGIVV